MFHIDPKAFVAEPELIRMLREHTSPLICEQDSPLFRQDDLPSGLHIFHEGSVTLSMISRGNQSLFAAQALPDSLLGLTAVVSDQPHTLTATARASSRISFLSRQDFKQLMLTKPALSLRILNLLAAQVHRARLALD